MGTKCSKHYYFLLRASNNFHSPLSPLLQGRFYDHARCFRFYQWRRQRIEKNDDWWRLPWSICEHETPLSIPKTLESFIVWQKKNVAQKSDVVFIVRRFLCWITAEHFEIWWFMIGTSRSITACESLCDWAAINSPARIKTQSAVHV